MTLFTKFFAILGQQSWELAAWTMCYFLAAGTVVALAGAVLRLLCKSLSPQFRYTLSLALFASLAALPVGIAYWLSHSPLALSSWPASPSTHQPELLFSQPRESVVSDVADVAKNRSTSLEATTDIQSQGTAAKIFLPQKIAADGDVNSTVPVSVAAPVRANLATNEPMVGRAIEFLPWLWLIGTPLTFFLLATGLIGSHRLRRQGTLLAAGPIYETLQRLRTSLAVSQRVGVAICERIATPLLIGIARPLILLPPAALTGWSPEELEMVLLHELAHVRRWDNLANFGQRLVESLLFFHPAVWWVSRWVRSDREECCDAVVVGQTDAPQAYAELLVALATPTTPLAGLAMAQHPLASRIRRILRLEEEKMLVSRSILGIAGLLVVAVLGTALWQPATPTLAEEPPAEVTGQKEVTTESTENTEELSESENSDENITVEDAESTEESEKSENATRTFAAGTPKSEVRKFVTSLNAKREDVSILHFEDGTTIVSGKKKMSLSTPVQPPGPERTSRNLDQEKNEIPSSPVEIRHPVFPTLEEQRAADLAYKLLGIELEQLNKEEIDRVKAMQFTGGLRVAHTELSRQGISSTQSVALPGDLLVGLHVWPTTSLADVKTVLQRDDLEELSPLKFYVIRKTVQRDGVRTKQIDQLVTGRIKVNTEAMKNRAIFYPSAPGASQPTRPLSAPVPPQPAMPTLKSDRSAVYQIYPPATGPRRPVPAKPHTLNPGDSVKVIVVGAYPDQPIDNDYTIESMGTLALGPTYGRVKVAGMTLLEAEKSVKKQLSTMLQDVEVQITMVTKNGRYSSARPQPTPIPTRPSNPTKTHPPMAPIAPMAPRFLDPLDRPQTSQERLIEPRNSSSHYAIQSERSILQSNAPRTVDQVDLPHTSHEHLIEPQQSTLQSSSTRYTPPQLEPPILLSNAPLKPVLRYDNKTFAQWRSLWKNELKTEKRTEAIQAMAAFGRAGYGKAAAEAILDVAGEYDFRQSNGNTPIEDLKKAIKKSLYGENGIPANDWVPILLQRLEKEPQRWSGLTSRVLLNPNVHSEQPDIQRLLLVAAKAPNYSAQVRGSALIALVNSDSKLKDESTVTLLRSALTSEETQLLTSALASLNFRHLDTFPEQLDLFVHNDASVRNTASMAFFQTQNPEIATKILDTLLAVLEDPQQAKKHLWAIQAILRNSGHFSFQQPLQNKQAEVITLLRNILVHGDNTLLTDTITTLDRLTQKGSAAVEIEQMDDLLTQQRREELAAALKSLQ